MCWSPHVRFRVRFHLLPPRDPDPHQEPHPYASFSLRAGEGVLLMQRHNKHMARELLPGFPLSRHGVGWRPNENGFFVP